MASSIINISPKYCLLRLNKGEATLIDPSDAEWLSKFTWHITDKGYARYTAPNGGVFMHKLILNTPKGMVSDHINGDRLDNRRCNLRIVTKHQNSQNRAANKPISSKYKGVGWKIDNNKWQARIRINLKQYHIGLYDSEDEAAEAYNAAALRHHGDHSRLNIIERKSWKKN